MKFDNYKNLSRMVSKCDSSITKDCFAGKKVLIASRHKPYRDPSCVYSVIGFYIGEILKLCEAKVDYYYLDSSVSGKINSNYDFGIACYYDTNACIRPCRKFFRHMRKSCRKTMFYSNLVPVLADFDLYGVSRKCYLDPNEGRYNRSSYSGKHFFERGVFIGRGCDPFLFKPCQDEKFTVTVDASRGPHTKRVIMEASEVIKSLEKEFRVLKIGIRNSKRGGFSRSNKKSYFSMTNVYNKSHIYISSIGGLYELPVIESQIAGNYVISYKNRLHPDLYNPETSSICLDIETLKNKVIEISGNHDSSLPRKWMIDNKFLWTDVTNRIAENFKLC